MTSARHLAAVTLILTSLFPCGCAEYDDTDSDFPRRPIKLIVPFAAGGGSDTFARIVQTAIEEQSLLPHPLVVINVPGAGGTIGSRRVKNARPDGYTILLLHEGILTAKHSGQASYGPEAFEPIAGTADAAQVIATRPDAPYSDLTALLAAAGSKPDSILFAANIGAPSHFAGLMLEGAHPDARFRYTQTGGGAKRFAALQGGHVDVTSFSIAEYSQFREAGIRALAILGPNRNPEFPEVQTAREQGYDVISQNMQFWWAPRGTPPERIAAIADVVCTAVNSPSVQQKLRELKMDPVTLRGDALAEELARRQRRIAAVATTQPADLPNFPAWTLTGVALLALIAAIRARQRRVPATIFPSSASGWQRPTAAIVITLIYIGSMSAGWLPFVPATAIYVMLLGGSLAIDRVTGGRATTFKPVLALCLAAALMSYAMHFLFTEVLVVDLP